MEEIYKGHRIQDSSTLNPDSQRWTPKITISWDEHGTKKFHGIDGPIDHCATKGDAEIYAIQMGKKWVDGR